MANVAYRVENITPEEVEQIRFLHRRYGWASVLAGCIVESKSGEFGLELTEVEAWQFHQGADEDGLQFTCAAPELAAKLLKLWTEVV